MKTVISSQITIENPSNEIKQWCANNLILTNPLYEQLLKRGQQDVVKYRHVPPHMDFCKHKGLKITVPFGCLYPLLDFILKGDIISDFAPKMPNSIAHLPCPIKLFDYQEDALKALLKAKGGVLEAGCGAGKTITGIELIHRIGQKFLWICHTKDLLRQAKNDFLKLYPNMDIGLITNGKMEIGKDGAISTIQTLANMDPQDYQNEFNVVIVDECHHASADMSKIKMFAKVLNNVKARYKYGLTATSFRNDTLTNTIYFNLGYNNFGQPKPTYVVDRSRIQSLTATYQKICVDTKWNIAAVNPDGTFNYNGLVTYLSENQQRNEFIRDEVKKLVEEGRKIAVLSLRVEHCQELAKLFEQVGISVKCMTGKTTEKTRKDILSNVDKWQVIVSTAALFKEGLDIKQLDTMMLVAPIKDKASIIQACGRCERPFPNKKQPIFIDICDIRFSYCVAACKKRESYIKNR